jgi:hypothetical protein
MSQRLIDSYLNGVNVRRTVRNWPEDVRAVIDGYRSYTTIAHAVQKDAIQNGWSARKNKKGIGWEFIFELVETPQINYLTMTDQGTIGLTGKVLSPEEYENDLPSEERWGRFEGVAFTQPRVERTIGSRGRGKFIFVGASKEMTVLYETLREDGIYRFGFRSVTKTESPVFACDGNLGKLKLKEITKGVIDPISKIGTRVIIVNPLDEVVKDIKKGAFLRYIGETWWEIIRKYDAIIKVISDGKENVAIIPEDFNLVEEDSKKYKIWLKKNTKIPIRFGDASIKNLHIVYSVNSSFPDDIKGISIQREGMKICTIESRFISKDLADKIYGYVNFESKTEDDLLQDEGIEHYSYDWRRALPGSVKRLIEDEILHFAQTKLGYGLDKREIQRQQQRNAERKALVVANNFARSLGIGEGPSKGLGGSGGERTAREVRIQMEELQLPRPGDLRINYGESVKNIKIRIINEQNRDIDMHAKIFIRYYDQIMKMIFEGNIKVSANSISQDYGPFEETLVKDQYPNSGKYTIAARIVSLMEEDKAVIFDDKTKSFYLENDPPMHGLFERCEAASFPSEEPIKYWMGYSEFGSERGLVLYYNLEHPGYSSVSENEDDLADYIIRIEAQEICRYDIMQENPKLFRGEQSKDPQEFLKQERRVVGELIYRYRRGVV